MFTNEGIKKNPEKLVQDKNKQSKNQIFKDDNGGYRCPHCRRDVLALAKNSLTNQTNQQLSSAGLGGMQELMRGFSAMSDIAAQSAVFNNGLTCACGKKLKPYKDE